MRARRWRVAAVVLALAAAVTACGRDGGGADAGRAGPVDGGPAGGELTVWAMGTEGEKLATLAKGFEAANPGVTVNVTAVPWDAAHDKITTAIAARQTPDVSLVGTTYMAEFAKSGALDQTPSLISGDEFFPGAWDTTVVNGTSYGVPWYVETRALYYRTDLAAKAGVSAPTSWEQLTATATAMQQKAGTKWGVNLQAAGEGTWQTFMPFFWQAGGSITDADGRFTLDSEAMVRALEYYRSFFANGISPATKLRPGELEQGFVDGSVGAFFSGPWHAGLVTQLGGAEFRQKWAVARMPRQATGISFVGGGDLAVFKDARNRDAAWKFVRYLTTPDVQVTWFETVGDLPAVRAAWKDPKLSQDPVVATFGEQLNETKSPPAIPNWAQVATVIDTQVELVVRGGVQPADGAKAIQAEATRIGTGS